jgi:hypothetical protein
MNGARIAADFFIRYMNPDQASAGPSSATDSPVGASIRWAIGIDDESNPHLEIQGLPAPAANIQKKFFSGDNSVSVLLGSFPLNADMFTGQSLAGLVPTFFSPLRFQASAYLQQNPDLTRDIICSINSRLLRMEHMTLEAAVTHLKAKKGRMAKGVPAFPAPTASRKRGRPTNQDIHDSGT